ncbi:MAG: hypothetical protein AVDCRST_MAG35-1385, partial [uncultured Quadrisphaera sp.]
GEDRADPRPARRRPPGAARASRPRRSLPRRVPPPRGHGRGAQAERRRLPGRGGPQGHRRGARDRRRRRHPGRPRPAV